jgi:hypothetical protein
MKTKIKSPHFPISHMPPRLYSMKENNSDNAYEPTPENHVVGQGGMKKKKKIETGTPVCHA